MKRQRNHNRFVFLLILCLALNLGGCRAAGQLKDELSQVSDGIAALLSENPDSHSPEKPDAASQDRPDSTNGAWEDVTYDPLLYPYYGQLSQDAQAVYRQVCHYAAAQTPSLEPCRNLTEDEAEAVMTAVYYDQPGLFWLDGDYEYRHLNGQVIELILHFNDLAQDLTANRQAFEKAALSILDEARQASEPAARERIVHDRLLEGVIYDENAPYNQNAYSALVGGFAVCAGYARAFQYLLLELEIPCYYCVGTAVSYRDGPQGLVEDHAWNIVCLDGEYYNVDPTWNDTLLAERGLISYGYYNQTDDAFLADHTRDVKSAELPACTGTRFTYKALYGHPAELGILPALGLSEEDVIYDLEAYYEHCLRTLVESGPGESTLTAILWGEELCGAVQDSINSGAYENGFLSSAAKELSLNGFHFSVHLSFQEMGGGCYLLEQSMTLE